LQQAQAGNSPSSERRSGSGRAAAKGVAALTAQLLIDDDDDEPLLSDADDSDQGGSTRAAKRCRSSPGGKAARSSGVSPGGGEGNAPRSSATPTAWQAQAGPQEPYSVQPVETEAEKELFFKLLADNDSGSNTFGSAASSVPWEQLVIAYNTAVTAAWDSGQPRDSLRMKNKTMLVRFYNSYKREERLADAQLYAQRRAAAAAGATGAPTAPLPPQAAAAAGRFTAAVGPSSSRGQQQQREAGRGGRQPSPAAAAAAATTQQRGVGSGLGSANWLAAAGQMQPPPTTKGKGLGGKGGGKKCVPCSLAADATLRTANDARARGSVRSSKAHTEGCPYCKCDECKKVWNANKGRVVVDRERLAGTLKVNAHPN
jgi:hypothetical protein